MNKVETFTSTGSKLIHHPLVISRLKSRMPTPVSLQVAPTSRCNLNCVFCSNTNRDKHEDLDLGIIQMTMSQLRIMGLKTVEWTGGGDPTQYKYINECINAAFELGLEQGFISNGIAVKDKLTKESLQSLHWLRISMNCLDYVDDVELPDFSGALGFSYVMNDKTTRETFSKLHQYVEKYSPRYVRVVPNCQATHSEQEHNNKVYSKFVKDLGEPYFYQTKTFERPKNCYWGYFKPFLLHDGWVYPCSSVVLNDNAERQFHSKYRWIRVEELPSVYDCKVKSFNPENCTHCVFTGQNRKVESILNPDDMVNFI